jgi:HlyD family secretion protein
MGSYTAMRKWIPITGIVLLAGMTLSIKLMRGGEAKQVTVERVSLQTLSPSILASGTLAYESEVKLVSEVIGRVREVFVKEGDFVKRGDLLLQLDPAAWLADVAQLDAAVRQSSLNIERQRVTAETQDAKWRRYESLRASGVVDANTYDEIVSQRRLAHVELTNSREMLRQKDAELKQARERLAKTELRAPIGGKVTSVLIKAGETAVPSAISIAGSDLMTVADTTSLYAQVNVDETDVARVSVGQQARIVPAAFPDQAWIGSVEQVAISPRQNPGQSKSYLVKIQLAQQASIQFHPGMSCRAEISSRSSDAAETLAVPVQAVRYEDSLNRNEKARASVFVAQSGKVQQRDVEMGVADDTYVEIVRGVKIGEEIVTGPAKTLRFLSDGDRVVAAVAAAVAVTSRALAAKP